MKPETARAVRPNASDQETIRTYELAELHVGGGCDCPERMMDGPSSPECLRALELACASAQHEVLEAFARARHDVWLTSMLFSARERIENLLERTDALETGARK